MITWVRVGVSRGSRNSQDCQGCEGSTVSAVSVVVLDLSKLRCPIVFLLILFCQDDSWYQKALCVDLLFCDSDPNV